MRRILAIAGLLGGLFWIVLGFFPPEGGPPGTAEYNDEVLLNRLWTPALFGMLLGVIGLFLSMRPLIARTAKGGFIAMLLGFALMISGNFAEYWILFEFPHQGSDGWIRGIAWMTLLSGTLLMLIASAVTGLAMSRTARAPKWLSLVFLLPLPLTIAIGLMKMSWAGMPIGILSVIVGSIGLLPDNARLTPGSETKEESSS